MWDTGFGLAELERNDEEKMEKWVTLEYADQQKGISVASGSSERISEMRGITESFKAMRIDGMSGDNAIGLDEETMILYRRIGAEEAQRMNEERQLGQYHL